MTTCKSVAELDVVFSILLKRYRKIKTDGQRAGAIRNRIVRRLLAAGQSDFVLIDGRKFEAKYLDEAYYDAIDWD